MGFGAIVNGINSLIYLSAASLLVYKNATDFFVLIFFSFFFLKILFIYSTEIETASERGNTSRGSGRGRSRLTAEEPDVGLAPRTLGSRPEPQADA